MKKKSSCMFGTYIDLFLACLVVGFLVLYFFLRNLSRKKITKYRFKEHIFSDSEPVTTIKDDPTIDISLIAPAYNEGKRVHVMLNESIEFLEKRVEKNKNYQYEIIIVNDGSKDNTIEVVEKYIKEKELEISGSLRLLKLSKNFGKGFAVRQGVLRAKGKHILMLDSDAASEISDLENLEKQLGKIRKGELGMAIGSRYQMESKAKRSFIRKVISKTWGIIFKLVTNVWNIKDTQCGFKLFTRKTAELLFLNANIERWAMDIELLMVAQMLNIPVVEVAITWREVDGSKLTLGGMLGIIRDLLLIRVFYVLRLWKVSKKPKMPR